MQRRDDMSNLTRYDPFNELVDDLFKGFFVRPMGYEPREAAAPRIKVDVAESNGAYHPRRGAALHPALPRQDHRHQVRRQCDDRRAS
jgi:hypothetical protein